MPSLSKPDGTLDLTAVQTLLGTELKGILERHGKIADHLQNVDREVPTDWQDAAQLAENDQVLEALEVDSRERIQALRFALRRIGEGSSETCLRCQGDINPKRLAALPLTALCVNCAADQ